MRRLIYGWRLLLAATLTVTAMSSSRMTDAQESNDLEATVAALVADVSIVQAAFDDVATTVEAQEKRIAALEGANVAFDQDPAAPVPAGDRVTVAGSGMMVSEKFTLAPARYRVSAMVETSGFDGFALYLHAEHGPPLLLFNELIESAQAWTGSTIVEVDGGEFFVSAENTTSPWQITFDEF